MRSPAPARAQRAHPRASPTTRAILEHTAPLAISPRSIDRNPAVHRVQTRHSETAAEDVYFCARRSARLVRPKRVGSVPAMSHTAARDETLGPHHHDGPRGDARGHEHAHGHSHGLIDPSIQRSRAGIRAVSISLAILGATALTQTAIYI